MVEELESVVLTRDVTESGLSEGDVGTVVHSVPGRAGLRGRVRDRRGSNRGRAHADARGPPAAGGRGHLARTRVHLCLTFLDRPDLGQPC